MTDDLASLFAYHRWADDRMLDACRNLSPAQYAEIEPFEVGWPSIRSVVLHLTWAGEVWAQRFLGEPQVPMFAESDLPTLNEAAARLLSTHDRFSEEILPSLTPDRLAGVFTYRTFKGVTYTVPMWAALRHVVNHGTYHRGQVASKLKRRGVDPPSTDLVYWAAENAPKT